MSIEPRTKRLHLYKISFLFRQVPSFDKDYFNLIGIVYFDGGLEFDFYKWQMRFDWGWIFPKWGLHDLE